MTKDNFINNFSNYYLDNIELRQFLVEKFEYIHNNVTCLHEPEEAYLMAHYILSNQSPGPLVEFGCFKGGMSCKLSFVAKAVNKQYIIFDSFNGLVYEGLYNFYDNRVADFRKGYFGCNLSDVIKNIDSYGYLPICSFIQGPIENTLPNLEIYPSFVFIDVDILETAQFIIKKLWNKMTCSLLFTHEGFVKEYMDGLQNKKWWNENFSSHTPKFGHEIYGLQYGIPNSVHLNFLIKDHLSKLITDNKELVDYIENNK